MTKLGNWKWYVGIAAFAILFTYHRQATRPTLGPSTALTNIAAEPMLDVLPSSDDSAEPVLVAQDPMSSESELEYASVAQNPDNDFDSIDAFLDSDPELAEASEPAASLPASVLQAPAVRSSEQVNNEVSPNMDMAEQLPARDRQMDQNGPSTQPNPSRTLKAGRLPEGIETKVVQHIEYGKSLARRGAVFGAKQEFINALRLVAEATDYTAATKQNTNRLHAALTALQEADDFYFAQSENNGTVPIAKIAQRHVTKILSPTQLESLRTVDAMQAYYNFAQQQLLICSGKTIVAGEALFCLGKLHKIKASNVMQGDPLDNAKAIVFHRAALDCDPQHFRSANELGVLMAKAGRYDQAKALFVHSLKVHQLPRAWENLALVHQRLGESRLAQLAESEYQRTLSGPASTQTARIQWIAPQTFAAQSTEPASLRTAQHAPNRAIENSRKEEPSRIKKIMKRLF